MAKNTQSPQGDLNTDQNVNTSQADGATEDPSPKGDTTLLNQQEGGTTESSTEGGTGSTENAEANGFVWVDEDEVGRTAQSKYDWDSFPAPITVNGKKRMASKVFAHGVGSKTIYGSFKTYAAKIAAQADKLKAENAKIAEANAKLPEGDPGIKPLHEIPVVPEFRMKENKDQAGKNGKVLSVTVTRTA